MKTKIKGNYVVADMDAVPVLYDSGYFGRPRDDGLYLRFVEAAYLLFRGKISMFKITKKPILILFWNSHRQRKIFLN